MAQLQLVVGQLCTLPIEWCVRTRQAKLATNGSHPLRFPRKDIPSTVDFAVNNRFQHSYSKLIYRTTPINNDWAQ